MPEPLVSCIMPTWNRRAFVPRAIRCFLAQDYPNLELVVVDDGSDPIRDLLPDDERIHYFRLSEKIVIGPKRNLACSHSAGEFIAHWDDDDWYPPSRITRQVEALRASNAQVAGSRTLYYYDYGTHRAYRYDGGSSPFVWMIPLLYRRAFWQNRPFEPLTVAEDMRFLAGLPPNDVLDLNDPSLAIAAIHDGNTSRKVTRPPFWLPECAGKIRALMGADALVGMRQR